MSDIDTRNWRTIRMDEIDWRAVQSMPEIGGHAGGALRRLSVGYPSVAAEPYWPGCWQNLTLGDVADLGERDLLRHSGFGKKTLAALRRVIDMAASGKLPLLGNPAPDALRPRVANKEP